MDQANMRPGRQRWKILKRLGQLVDIQRAASAAFLMIGNVHRAAL